MAIGGLPKQGGGGLRTSNVGERAAASAEEAATVSASEPAAVPAAAASSAVTATAVAAVAAASGSLFFCRLLLRQEVCVPAERSDQRSHVPRRHRRPADSSSRQLAPRWLPQAPQSRRGGAR